MAGRKKKERCIEIDFDQMMCHCFGPLDLDDDELEKRPKIHLEPDELQTLVYQDIEGLTMDVACAKMGISKTVYAGIYSGARYKVAKVLMDNGILLMNCMPKK